jgi:hypothetical protein
MKYWFYMQTFGVTTMHEDGKKRFSLASVMIEMKPLTKVNPSEEMTPQREACDKAFALACHYPGGQDLVKEMVASICWPLGKLRPSFKIKMVNIPVYGPTEGVPFPQFGIELTERESPDDFVSSMEEGAREIVDDISDKEFLAWRAIGGMMPCLNQVFEELGIHHGEHKVPTKVLKSIEDKVKKAATKNATMVAESKKRRGAGGPKVVSKKQKVIPTSTATSAAASATASADVGEEVAKNVA